MRNILRKWKLFFALTLSMAMLVVQMPLTVLAASDETISAEEETQTGTIRDEDTSAGEQSEEGSPEEGTDKDSEGEKGNEGESGKDAGEGEGETGKDTGDSEGESGKDAEDGEGESGKDAEGGEGESGKDAEGGEEESGKDSEAGEVEADQDSEREEETEEDTEIEEGEEGEEIEEADEFVESAEEIMLMSASDFVITNGVLKSYTGTEEDVEIPTGVVTIGASSFRDNKTIKTVKFSSNVKTIGNSAFRGCTVLKEVTLNEGLETIGNNAFQETALGEKLSNGTIQTGTLVIPSTVQSVGGAALTNCKYLGEVKFADGDTEVLELLYAPYQGTISACPMLTRVELPSRLKVIPNYAFSDDTALKEVVFGDKLETIGDLAFSGCKNLNIVDLKEGLVTIGHQAFQGAALGEKLSNGLIKTGTLVIPSTVKSIGGAAFTNCQYLGEVKFADGAAEVLELSSDAYVGTISRCPMLTRVELPSRLRVIPDYAFSDDTALKEVVFGDKLETIGDLAFSGCKNLNIVDLKEGLVTIGHQAFQGAALGEKLSNGAIKTGTLVIPSTVQNIGGAAFTNCQYLGEVKFADGHTGILELSSDAYVGTISRCPMLTRVELPSRLRVIPNYAFSDDTALKEVVFGDKLETIGDLAFSGCKSLKSADLPASLRKIGGKAFEQCNSLAAVDLKEGLITIGGNAFWGAPLGEESSNTGSLVIPGSVQSIGGGAFYQCAYLRKVIFASGEAAVLSIKDTSGIGATFGECPELTMIILPERITRLWADNIYGTVGDNPKLQTLYIPEGVTEIKNGAISNCPKLTIYGVSGSAAETYAKQNNIPFKNQKPEIDSAVQSVNVTPGVIEEIGESAIGKKIQLTVTVLPDTALNRAVSYASENETVATVDQKGLVTITGYGETRITVTTADGGKTASCRVVVSKEAVNENPDIKDATALFPKKAAAYSAIYTGEQIRPVMTVTYPYTDANGKSKTQTLKLNVDYTISYRNNVNVGQNTASVTVRGIGEYKGVITKTFTITPKSIQNVILSQAGDIVYGETPSVVVMDGTYELTKDKDYEVVLSTSGSANEDTQCVLTVKGMGNYTGTSKKSVKFNILKTGTDIQPITSKTIRVAFKKLPAKGYTYNGKAQKPAVVVTDSNTGKKVAASNYKVIYTNNINAGTASVRVVGVSKKGKGYYGSSAPLTFEIKPKDLNKVKVSTKGLIPKAGTIEDMKKSVEEALTVKDGKHILSTDEYVIDYGNIRSAGDIKVGTKYPITLTARAGGNYVAGTQKVFHIKFGQLSFASWTAKISVRIINAEQNEILLRYNGTLLEKGKDYTAVVKKDKNRDTYTVTVKAVKNGAYKGSRTFKKLTVD